MVAEAVKETGRGNEARIGFEMHCKRWSCYLSDTRDGKSAQQSESGATGNIEVSNGLRCTVCNLVHT